MAVTGFLTDSTLCIGCKACEVACKEWNGVSDDGFVWSGLSYDNTQALGHSPGATSSSSRIIPSPDWEATPLTSHRGVSYRMSADIARMPDALSRVPRAPSYGRNSAVSLFSPTCVMAADIAL